MRTDFEIDRSIACDKPPLDSREYKIRAPHEFDPWDLRIYALGLGLTVLYILLA